MWSSRVGIGTRLLAGFIEESFHSRLGTRDSLLERAEVDCAPNHHSYSRRSLYPGYIGRGESLMTHLSLLQAMCELYGKDCPIIILIVDL